MATKIGGGGGDRLIGTRLADTLIGKGGGDRLFGLGGADRLNGGSGNDSLDGGTGADTMIGGTGSDRFLVDNAGDVVVEAKSGGTDTIFALANATLPKFVERLVLLKGNPLKGTGNGLDNVMIGNIAANRLSGSSGDDTIGGAGGNDSLLGGSGVDTLFGDAGDDTLSGGDSGDTLEGGAGKDLMAGGRGNDVYGVDDIGDTAIESSGNGTDAVFSTVSYTIGEAIERLFLVGATAINGTGNDGANQVIGNAATNTLSGGAGDDTLEGRAGDDRLNGDDGNDVLDGGTGNDAMMGGQGDDIYIVTDVADLVEEGLNQGIDTLLSFLSIPTLVGTNIENVFLLGTAPLNATGDDAANQLRGNGVKNILQGRGGDDVLAGFDGDDSLAGESGRDTLSGGNGSDLLVGGEGDDSISGEAGIDELRGGAGADTLTGGTEGDGFLYVAVGDAGAVLTNVTKDIAGVVGDTVTDFATGVDRFAFVRAAFNSDGQVTTGLLDVGVNFSTIADAYDGTNQGTNTEADAGRDAWVFSSADRTLYYDANGDGDGYFVIATVQDGAVVTANDVIIV